MIIKYLGTTLIIITGLAMTSIAFGANAGSKHDSWGPKVRIAGNNINLGLGLRKTVKDVAEKALREVKINTHRAPRLHKPRLNPGRQVEKSVNWLNKGLIELVRSEKRARGKGSRHSYSDSRRDRHDDDDAHKDRYQRKDGHANRDSSRRHRDGHANRDSSRPHRDAHKSRRHSKPNGHRQNTKRHKHRDKHYSNRHNYYRARWYNTFYLSPIPYFYYSVGYGIRILPKGYVKVIVGGIPYFYFSGTFYKASGSGYVVVSAPYGAIVRTIPTGYVAFTVGLSTFYHVNDTYYVWDDRREAYIVSTEPVDAGQAIESATKERLFVYPKIGQDEELQSKDRYECHRWAVTESGVDPTLEEREYGQQETNNYKHAISACLVARDYSVK